MTSEHYDNEKLKKLRGGKGLREAARDMGVTPNKLARAESGEVCTYEFLCELATHYQIPVGQLLHAVQAAA